MKKLSFILAVVGLAFHGAFAGVGPSPGSQPPPEGDPVDAKPPPKPTAFRKCGSMLQKVYDGEWAPPAAMDSYPRPAYPTVVGDKVLVDAVADSDANQLAADLEALGMENATVFGRVVSGQIPVSALASVEKLPSLRFARPSMWTTDAGAVTSQGDPAMKSDVARSAFGVQGNKVKVGILSDSFDKAGTQTAADQATGDLPPSVTVLVDYPDGMDEGRAMAQIVHDVAPGASILFHTAMFPGMAAFAQGILTLQSAGCKVVTDDVIYYEEPMFADGVIAQAIDTGVASGVAHFSSAGNRARQGWDEPAGFRPSGYYFSQSGYNQEAHDFDAGPGVDPFLDITVPAKGKVYLVFQWAQPYASAGAPAGAQTDLDIYVFAEIPNPPYYYWLGYAEEDNIGGDPTELLYIYNGYNSPVNAKLLIGKYNNVSPNPQPDPPFLKMVWWNSFTINEYPALQNKATTYGHANSAGAVAVGAAYYGDTPEYGQDPPLLEYFSSAGGTPIFFNPDGTPVNLDSSPIVRQKPDVVGPDGVDTTFFYPGLDYEPNGYPNFFGTSAAAPHVAGIAALALEKLSVTPGEIRTALQNTAIDMGAYGFDYDTGYGFVQADKTLAALWPLGDLNYDGCVDRTDLALIMVPIRARSTDLNYDLNDDGNVNISDARYLATLFTNPGGAPCGPTPTPTPKPTSTSKLKPSQGVNQTPTSAPVQTSRAAYD